MIDDLHNRLADIKQRDRGVQAFVEYCEVPQPNPSKDGRFRTKTPEDVLPDWTFAIKSNIAVAGMAHTAGIGSFRERISVGDAFCVARLRDAGVHIVGVVNMEEAALGALTDNPHFGKTHNPRRHGYTPGGSSGGSAAAVAAGLVRVALGTDTMGSSRIPAAYCGVVGFKPSYGRISAHGVEPLARRLDHVGIFANSVADVGRAFGMVDVFDSAWPGARRYPADLGATAPTTTSAADGRPRLVVLDAAACTGLEEAVRLAYTGAIAALKDAGYSIIERSLSQAGLAKARRAGLLICEMELGETLAALVARDDPGLSAPLKKMIAFGATKNATDRAAAHAAIDATQAVLHDQLQDADAVFWPTAPQCAFAFDEAVPSNQADFTCLANFTGAPAISLPLAVPFPGMPVGGQLMVRLGEDQALLRLAAAVAPIVDHQTQHESMS